METNKELTGMLDLLIRPGFCVKDNIITYVNSAAENLLILPGTDIRTLLLTGCEEYTAFESGCLYLKLNLSSNGCGASVSRLGDQDVFVLDQESDDGELRAMALAARELREPLSSMMISADHLAPALENAEAKEQLARLNRGLYQLLRIVGNMSDAGHTISQSRQEVQNISIVLDEIFEKAKAFVEHTGIELTWQGLSENVLCLADSEQLERAILNILSNAIKFTPKGGSIRASLTRRRKMLLLHIQDSGSGIAESIQTNLFRRYLRQPGIEDRRYGIGLGMVLIRAAAANHGGTILIDQPEGAGTRVTMTIALRQNSGNTLRSPLMRIDYTGEQDHALVELSECLPVALYEK